MKSREVRDELLKSAADSQRSQGQMPTAANNEQYLTGILNGMDRKASDKPKAYKPAPTPSTKKPGAFKHEAERRARQHGFELTPGWSVNSTKDVPLALGGPVYTATIEGVLKRRLRARIRLLSAKHDWADKLKAVNPLALQGSLGPDKLAHAMKTLWDIMDSSNVIFGEWFKEAPKTMYSYKGLHKC